MRLPDFLGIGAQKGGTTYLHGLLKCHPHIFLATPKEQQFFSLHWQRGVAWYSNQFELAELHQCCGEITPYYLFHPEAPKRIHALHPTVKLIVLLRDPVERTLSQYFHSRRLGLETLELEAALDAEAERLDGSETELAAGHSHQSHQQHSYLSRSRYEEQLNRYLKYFPPSQLLVLSSESLFACPQNSWAQVLDFLELDQLPVPEVPPMYVGEGESEAVDPLIKSRIRQQLASTYAWMEVML